MGRWQYPPTMGSFLQNHEVCRKEKVLRLAPLRDFYPTEKGDRWRLEER